MRRPVQQGLKACARKGSAQHRHLRVINAKRYHAQAHHDAGVRAPARGPVQIALGLTVSRWVPDFLRYRPRRDPVDRPGWQHWKQLQNEDDRP